MTSSLKEMLQQQRSALRARDEGIEAYRKAHTPPIPWEGFWTFFDPRAKVHRVMHITQDSEASAVGRWREGGQRMLLRGSISQSRMILEGATIHRVRRGGREDVAEDLSFVSPMSLKMGAGHASIAASFDWAVQPGRGSDATVLSRLTAPNFALLYTTADGSQRGHAQERLRRIAAMVVERCPDDVCLAPLTTASDSEAVHGEGTQVTRTRFVEMLENEDLAMHWSRGGSSDPTGWGGSGLAGVVKDDVERVAQCDAKVCVSTGDMRGAAQVRQQRFPALLLHLEIVEEAPAGGGLVLPPRCVDSFMTVGGVFSSDERAAAEVSALLLAGRPSLRADAKPLH